MPETELSREELWTLYKAATDDRNFQVTLNWDRTKHYFIFNVALFSIAGTLSRLNGLLAAQIALFVLAGLNSLFGAYAMRRGHEYYRAARRHLARVERQLGLVGEDLASSAFARQTTRGTVREITGRAPSFLDQLTITRLAITLQVFIAFGSGAAVVQILAMPRP